MGKLLKPLYGLDDASRKLWLKVRELFLNIGFKTLERDEPCHLNDLTLPGQETFLKEIIEGIKTCMNVSKVEENDFRNTGLDVERYSDRIIVSMDDYVDSLAKIKEIKKV